MIFVIDHEGRFFCNDNKWRSYSSFGTSRGCVKEYRKLGWAENRAEKEKARVVVLPSEVSINMAGRITKEVPCPDKPNHHTIEELPISSFVVYSKGR